MSNDIEIRSFMDMPKVEGRTISGYAAVFNSLSETLHARGLPFREVIRPGAFTRALKNINEIKGMIEHKITIARRSKGTLRLEQDAKGLRYEIDAPSTAAANDAIEDIRHGNFAGSSFSFGEVKDVWRKEGMNNIREIHEFVAIGDVGPVCDPAYAATDVTVRSLQKFDEMINEGMNAHEIEMELKRMRLRILAIED